MALDTSQLFTQEHAERMFRRATCRIEGCTARWEARAQHSMTDAEVSEALAYEMQGGGGGCGPDSPSYEVDPSGLRIWVGWEIQNPCLDRPRWRGASTVAEARRLYGLRRPSDERQYDLFGTL
jgi:hypothetical protein